MCTHSHTLPSIGKRCSNCIQVEKGAIYAQLLLTGIHKVLLIVKHMMYPDFRDLRGKNSMVDIKFMSGCLTYSLAWGV